MATTVTEKNKKKWKLDEELENYLRSLPKVELHVHLDGAFDPFLLKAHLESSGDYSCLPETVNLPWEEKPFPVRQLICESTDPLKFHSLCTCRGKRSLEEMIKCFEVFTPIVRGNLSLLEKLAHDFVKRQADQNIIYTEVRYSPHLLADGGTLFGDERVDAMPVVKAVTKGLRAGEKEFNVTVNQILCCLSWRPDWAADVIDLAHELRNDKPCRVVGVDIAAGEEHFDEEKFHHLHEPHYAAFRKAKDLNVNITLHAGEVGDASNIRKAVEHYGAKRIGHGYRIVHDEKLMDEMAKKNVHFEICPTSSVETGGWDYKNLNEKDWKKHPAMIMRQKKITISLNSDDPAVFDTSLTWQLRIAIAKMGLERDCLAKIIHDSIDAAFITDEEKEELKKSIKSGNRRMMGSFKEKVHG